MFSVKKAVEKLDEKIENRIIKCCPVDMTELREILLAGQEHDRLGDACVMLNVLEDRLDRLEYKKDGDTEWHNLFMEKQLLKRIERLEANARCCSNGFQNEEHDCQKKPEPCSHEWHVQNHESCWCKKCGIKNDHYAKGKPTTKDDYIRIPRVLAEGFVCLINSLGGVGVWQPWSNMANMYTRIKSELAKEK